MSFMSLVIYERALHLKILKVYADCYLLFKTSLLERTSCNKGHAILQGEG